MKKQKTLKIVYYNNFDIRALSNVEQKIFYSTLLTRILELYNKQKEVN